MHNRIPIGLLCLFAAFPAAGDDQGNDPVAASIAQLKDPDPYKRGIAADRLGSLGPKATAVVRALAAALDDAHPNVRDRAILALSEIGPGAAEAIPALLRIATTGSSESADVYNAFAALSKIGPAAVPAIAGALHALGQHPGQSSRPDALRYTWALVKMTPPAIPALLAALRDDSSRVRAAAIHALELSIPSAEAIVPAVTEALDDANADVRLSAALILWRRGAEARVLVPILIAALGTEEPKRRVEVIGALEALGPDARAAVPALIGALKDKGVAGHAARALGAIGRESRVAVPALIEALRAPPWFGGPRLGDNLRLQAIEALGQLGPAAARAVPALVAALGTIGVPRDPSVIGASYVNDGMLRRAASEALARVGAAAVPDLIEALRDRDAEIRTLAASALAAIGPEAGAAVPALIAAFDRTPLVATEAERRAHDAAADALAAIGADAAPAIPALINAVQGKQTWAGDALAFHASIALGAIGPQAEAALPALIASSRCPPAAIAGIGPAAIAFLTPITDDRTIVYTRRTWAFDALSLIGPPAMPYLEGKLSDTESQIRHLGREALERKFRDLTTVVFSLDGNQALTASYDRVRLWDRETGKELRRFVGHKERVHVAVFSPDGTQVVTAAGEDSAEIWPEDMTTRLWDVRTGMELRRFQNDGFVHAISLSPDGRWICTVEAQRESQRLRARLWDARTGESPFHREMSSDKPPLEGDPMIGTPVPFGPDGRTILGHGYRRVLIWDAATGSELQRFEGHAKAIRSAVFSADGQFVLTASDDASARLWDVPSGRQVRTFQGHQGPVVSAVFSADGARVITASADRTVRLWDAKTAQEIRRFTHPTPVDIVSVSSDGQRILANWQPPSGRDENEASLWETSTGREVRRFKLQPESPAISLFSPDGKMVLTSSQPMALWSAETGELIRQYK